MRGFENRRPPSRKAAPCNWLSLWENNQGVCWAPRLPPNRAISRMPAGNSAPSGLPIGGTSSIYVLHQSMWKRTWWKFGNKLLRYQQVVALLMKGEGHSSLKEMPNKLAKALLQQQYCKSSAGAYRVKLTAMHFRLSLPNTTVFDEETILQR